MVRGHRCAASAAAAPPAPASRQAGWFWKLRNVSSSPCAGNDLLDAIRADSADQLVLEILDADVGRVAEHAPEVALLAGVAEPDDPLAVVLVPPRDGSPARRRSATISIGPREVEAELRRNRLERDPVGDAFDEDRRPSAGR